MPAPSSKELYGLTIVRAPGGGLVLIRGPIDLSRAESLSPRWVREKKETRPMKVELPPDKNDGSVRTVVAPVLTVVGEQIVHGESVPPTLRRLNTECGHIVNAAVASEELPLGLFEALSRPKKAEAKPIEETAQQKRERGERALELKNKSDDAIRQKLLAMGRKKSDVEKYLHKRNQEKTA